MARKLYRSRTNRVLLGVCGGLAEHFDWDPTLVRVLTVVSLFVSGVGLIAYIVMAIAVPVEPQQPPPPAAPGQA